MRNKHGLIFIAQSKLIASYWKTSTFHGFGQMCLSEVLCLMMLKLGGPWHKSQQLTQLQPVSEAHAATARCFQQVTWRPVKHRFGLIYCTGKQKHRFWWLPSISYHVEPDDLKNIWSEIKMTNCHLYLSVREQLHKSLAALWSEECLWLMS